MTEQEGAIVGAFTGVLCGEFSALHRYIEKIMERPVFTHELGGSEVIQEIKEKSKRDFIALAEEASGLK